MAFQDTENKAHIRRSWDLPILRNWQTLKGRPLSYIGLPGPDIRDLRDWKNVLGKITGVESPGTTKRSRELAASAISRMQLNANIYGLSSGFQILTGDIEDVIINVLDVNNIKPQLNDGKQAHLARLLYDIVNLDFDGGLGYVSRTIDGKIVIKRTDALKKLFERQYGTSFVFFLTINVRNTIKEQIKDYLIGWRDRNNGEEWQRTLDWYLKKDKSNQKYMFKAVIPSFVQALAEVNGFSALCYPPIVYTGFEDAQMIHFAFEVNHKNGSLRGYSKQNDSDLINLPLLSCEDAELRMLRQHPMFDENLFFDRAQTLFPDEIKLILPGGSNEY